MEMLPLGVQTNGAQEKSRAYGFSSLGTLFIVSAQTFQCHVSQKGKEEDEEGVVRLETVPEVIETDEGLKANL